MSLWVADGLPVRICDCGALVVDVQTVEGYRAVADCDPELGVPLSPPSRVIGAHRLPVHVCRLHT